MRNLYFKAMVLGLVLLGWAGSSFAQINLIEYTNVWRFMDLGNDLGTTWRNTSFSDSSWASGPGILGYAANEPVPVAFPIQTLPNRFKSDGTTQVITYYFRTHFNVTNTSKPFSVTVSNVLDDGAVFYLNGAEVGRIGMPAGTVLYATLASRADEVGGPNNNPAGHGVEGFTINTNSLLVGDNVMAVELHQGGTTSSDAVFGMRLTVVYPAPPVITTQPVSQTVQQGTAAAFTVAAIGPSLTYRWYRNGAFITGATTTSYSIASTTVANEGNYSVVVSNSFGSVTSSIVTLTVVSDTFPPLLVSAIASDTVSNRLDVTFSERLNPASATTLGNYLVNPLCSAGSSLLATQAQLNVNVVRLTLNGALKFGSNYTLVVNNVKDASINSNTIAPPDNAVGVTFNYTTNIFDMGQVWRWHEDQTPGTTWRDLNYNDDPNKLVPPFWGEGAGIFYDEFDDLVLCQGTLNQSISLGPTTYYFRTRFVLSSNVTARGTLKLRHFVDDGVVFYLNGVEILRYNLPAGPISAGTLASSDIEAACVGPVSIVVTNLLPGTNLLAAELHQSSSVVGIDAVFGADLDATFQIVSPVPEVFIAHRISTNFGTFRTNVVVSWDKALACYHLESTTNLSTAGPWSAVAGATSPYTNSAAGPLRIYRLKSGP